MFWSVKYLQVLWSLMTSPVIYICICQGSIACVTHAPTLKGLKAGYLYFLTSERVQEVGDAFELAGENKKKYSKLSRFYYV